MFSFSRAVCIGRQIRRKICYSNDVLDNSWYQEGCFELKLDTRVISDRTGAAQSVP